MTQLVTALAKYRAYHRDGRNVATHMLGIPMIVLAVEILLSRPMLVTENGWLTLARVLSFLAMIYYLRLDVGLGVIMAVLLSLASWLGLQIAQQSTLLWLGWGIGLFVGGWVLQFIGHYFEGRKPAFVDDIKSLLIGPLFVVAEWVFALGLRGELRKAVAAQSDSSG